MKKKKKRERERERKKPWLHPSVETFSHLNLAEKRAKTSSQCLSNLGTLFSKLLNPILKRTYGYGLCSNLHVLLD